MPRVADHLAERVAEAAGISRMDSSSRKFASGVGFSNGWAEFDVEKSAAVGAELLDRDLRGGRAHGERLRVKLRAVGRR